MATDFTNLDPQVVTLAKAIRTTESNNNYQAVGDNGDSHGAYQFNKGNFAHWASEEGLDPNDFSPVNQDKVAYAKIKAWKDQGYHAGEIAAMWNGAHLDANKRPVANNPQYVTKVQQALQNTPSYNPKPFSNPAASTKLDLTPPTVNPPDNSNQVVSNDNGLGDVAKGLGKGILNFGKGLVEPELKATASGIRSIQAIPQLVNAIKNGDYQHTSLLQMLGRPEPGSQLDQVRQTMAQPLLGQKTFEGSTIDQNLGSAATGALQVGGLLTAGGGEIPGASKATGLLQDLANNKTVKVIKTITKLAGAGKAAIDVLKGKGSTKDLLYSLPELMSLLK